MLSKHFSSAHYRFRVTSAIRVAKKTRKRKSAVGGTIYRKQDDHLTETLVLHWCSEYIPRSALIAFEFLALSHFEKKTNRKRKSVVGSAT